MRAQTNYSHLKTQQHQQQIIASHIEDICSNLGDCRTILDLIENNDVVDNVFSANIDSHLAKSIINSFRELYSRLEDEISTLMLENNHEGSGPSEESNSYRLLSLLSTNYMGKLMRQANQLGSSSGRRREVQQPREAGRGENAEEDRHAEIDGPSPMHALFPSTSVVKDLQIQKENGKPPVRHSKLEIEALEAISIISYKEGGGEPMAAQPPESPAKVDISVQVENLLEENATTANVDENGVESISAAAIVHPTTLAPSKQQQQQQKSSNNSSLSTTSCFSTTLTTTDQSKMLSDEMSTGIVDVGQATSMLAKYGTRISLYNVSADGAIMVQPNRQPKLRMGILQKRPAEAVEKSSDDKNGQISSPSDRQIQEESPKTTSLNNWSSPQNRVEVEIVPARRATANNKGGRQSIVAREISFQSSFDTTNTVARQSTISSSNGREEKTNNSSSVGEQIVEEISALEEEETLNQITPIPSTIE